jgi:hypothetical protein
MGRQKSVVQPRKASAPELGALGRRKGDRITTFFCRSAECPLLAQSEHPDALNQCPLLGVKRTLPKRPPMSAFDPKRTLIRLGGGLVISEGGTSTGRKM